MSCSKPRAASHADRNDGASALGEPRGLSAHRALEVVGGRAEVPQRDVRRRLPRERKNLLADGWLVQSVAPGASEDTFQNTRQRAHDGGFDRTWRLRP